MIEETKAGRETYYREAASWSQDRQDALRSSRRVAWIVASVACSIAAVEGFALMLLAPLKTVEPYTLLVDRQTGYVEALKPLDARTVSGDTALTQSFLVQYVIARESFDISALQDRYRKVALWSADTARTSYISGIQVNNPDSPLNRYPRSTQIETQVKSVSPMGQNSALVRFDTRRVDRNGQPQSATPWVAVIRFRYSGEPMRVEDRYLNPLGFQVVHYRKDPEALPSPPSVAPPANSSSATAPQPAPPGTAAGAP
ncbi:virB8 family protein [Sphingobium lignivorans]|uniref:Type IV secretion system protein VirB8 n=1 Tax=Sphingobium lignivorans TaxID=2735886 RepID=A0ABR6NHS6_9SPHN|nr:type IV secretion system protein [Sphingobium lignivorans]MBB5986646.1 type IV secretion system protein VirB8 [Sphingobium lignivorans]